MKFPAWLPGVVIVALIVVLGSVALLFPVRTPAAKASATPVYDCGKDQAAVTTAGFVADGILADVEVSYGQVRIRVNNRRWAALSSDQRSWILLSVNRAMAGCDYVPRLILEDQLGREIRTYEAVDLYRLR